MLFPSDDRTVVYSTRDELVRGIADGTAPSVLRADLPNLEDLLGKPIGYGRPKVKRFQSSVKTKNKPLSSWILASSAGLDERAVVPVESNTLEVSTNREATQTVARILGEKLFSYPKPVSLYRALLEQSTSPDGGDIVLDFFAGSGTTGHAVLELNASDGGDRRFILISNTEATDEEPGKNICRSVCRERVARVMAGYQVKGKGNKKGKAVEGLGGGFAYLRAVRLPMETVSAKLQHQWVWTAIQLLHAESVQSLMPRKEVKVLSLPDSDIVYVPEINDEAIASLTALFSTRTAATVYSWRPGVLRQEFLLEGVTFEKIPDTLIARFGGRR